MLRSQYLKTSFEEKTITVGGGWGSIFPRPAYFLSCQEKEILEVCLYRWEEIKKPTNKPSLTFSKLQIDKSL